MWILIGIGTIILMILYFFYQKIVKHHVSTMFIAIHNNALEKGKRENEALLEAVNFFSYRFPFNELTDLDKMKIVSIASEMKDPLLLVQLFQYCEKNKRVFILKDYNLLRETLRKMEDQQKK